MSKEIWGPKAWHLIHNFSIRSNDNECMMVLINNFGYILPCQTCKKHYLYLINDIYPITNINKINMIHYMIDIHNIINDDLDKSVNLSYKEAIEVQKKTKNKDILYFMTKTYSQMDYATMSFFEFDKVFDFFVCFVKLYPTKNIHEKLNKLIQKKSFQEIDTPKEFGKWIQLYFSNDFF